MPNTLKLASEFNRYFTSSNGVDVPERVSVSRDEWRQLFAALSQQPTTPEPFGYFRAMPFGWEQCAETDEGAKALYEHPAPIALEAPKDNQIAALVNKVRDIARMFHDHQSLRDRIAIELVPVLKASQEVQSNAERWIYAIADGGNQSMNFMDIFGDWDGDGSFVEVFDAARLADKQKGSAA